MSATSLSLSSTQTKPMRIAMVAPSLEILGGQGVQAFDLSDALQKEGFRVQFMPVNPRFPWGLKWLRKIPYARTVLNQLLYIASLHRLRHVDVVHVFSASYWSFLLAPVPAIVAARLFGKRIVLNYHSGEADDHLANWGRRVHPWLRMVDEIVVPSVYLKEVFARFGYETRVIRNIVDISSFRFRERSPLQPRILTTRNLENLYDVGNTLEAFALFQKKFPEASLTVGGFGSAEAKLKALAVTLELKHVEFIGRVEPIRMPAVYDGADVFLNSSLIDNQPLSILEAFAAGLAVISTPTGDIPAMVRDGETGTLVPHKDPEAMAAAMVKLFDDPARTALLVETARLEVDRYTWPHVCEEWAQLYNKVKA